jgi:hypothetical protein
LLPVAHGGVEVGVLTAVVPETSDPWHVVPLAQSAFDAQLWALASAGAPSTMATAEASPKRIFVVDMGLRCRRRGFSYATACLVPRTTEWMHPDPARLSQVF